MNDLGGGCDGVGKSSSEADNLVKIIQQVGGKAVSDYSEHMSIFHYSEHTKLLRLNCFASFFRFS